MKPYLSAAMIENNDIRLLTLEIKKGQLATKHYLTDAIDQMNWRYYKSRLSLLIPCQFVYLQTEISSQPSNLYQDSHIIPMLGRQQINGHEDAIERLTEKLPLKPRVLEPAPQAWVRCTNYFLPRLPAYARLAKPATQWTIIFREQHLYIVLRVTRGVLVSLHSISLLEAINIEELDSVVMSYLSTEEDDILKARLFNFSGLWQNLCSATQSFASEASPALIGAALRGFFPWRG